MRGYVSVLGLSFVAGLSFIYSKLEKYWEMLMMIYMFVLNTNNQVHRYPVFPEECPFKMVQRQPNVSQSRQVSAYLYSFIGLEKGKKLSLESNGQLLNFPGMAIDSKIKFKVMLKILLKGKPKSKRHFPEFFISTGFPRTHVHNLNDCVAAKEPIVPFCRFFD